MFQFLYIPHISHMYGHICSAHMWHIYVTYIPLLYGCAHDWFQSCLSGRFQPIRCGESSSTPNLLICGVPQGSVLEPILFFLYTADLLRLIRTLHLHLHLYADDTQIYGNGHTADTSTLQSRVAMSSVT